MSNSKSTEMMSLKDTWCSLLPNATMPADDQWALWLFRHGFQTASQAIGELAVKDHKLNGAMDDGYRLKFASAVANRLTRESAIAGASVKK